MLHDLEEVLPEECSITAKEDEIWNGMGLFTNFQPFDVDMWALQNSFSVREKDAAVFS